MHDGIFDGLLAVQFQQEKPGATELRYQAGPQWNEGRLATMRSGLMRKLGDDFDLALKPVAQIEKTPAGKHRWLVKKP